MITLCTLFNTNYLDKGLTMYESIECYTHDFVLYVLCMDDRCYEIITDLNLPRFIPIKLSDIETPRLLKVKEDRTVGEYCWTCGSCFTDYVMRTFNPEYCNTARSVTEQMEEGCRFFARKYPDMRFLAYFQAYTNTYGEMERLVELYEEALSVPGVVGLVIGTRPDCMPDVLLDYLEELNQKKFLLVEYGIESTYDETLRRINRGHTFAETETAIKRTSDRGIRVGGHVILGLPGETHAMMINQAKVLSDLPLTTLKLHQLQLVRGTRMAHEYELHPEDFNLYDVDEYIELVIDYIEHLRSDIVLERFVSQSPRELLIAPDWGLKNHEFTARLRRRMEERDSWQGKSFYPG